MARVFLAVPQYRKIPESEIQRIRSELGIGEQERLLDGFHPMFDQSIRDLHRYSRHRFNWFSIYGDGNLPRARSNALGVWRQKYDTNERCDYLMNMDDDISFPPWAIDRLIEDDKPIICGIYTFRNPDPFYKGKVCTRIIPDKVTLEKPFEVRWANGGFMLIKAEVLLAMIDAYKDLEIGMDPREGIEATKTWVLWNPMVFERTLLGEDWAFCQRAREIGYDIWADLRIELVHWDAEYGYAIHLDKNNIEGWMTERELSWLSWKAKEMASIVELGSWKGRSTYALLSECKGTVYAVDHFNGDSLSPKQQSEVKKEDIYKAFMKNVGHFPNLKVLKMDSVEASNQVDSAEMVFIDTEHSYECASKELDAWLPKTKKLICGHDYDRPGIQQAVLEKLGEVKTFDTIWYKELR